MVTLLVISWYIKLYRYIARYIISSFFSPIYGWWWWRFSSHVKFIHHLNKRITLKYKTITIIITNKNLQISFCKSRRLVSDTKDTFQKKTVDKRTPPRKSFMQLIYEINILNSMKSRRALHLIFLRLLTSMAHTAFLEKPLQIYTWIKTFLFDRPITVTVDDHNSNVHTVHSCVSQRSVLSYTSFLLHINYTISST